MSEVSVVFTAYQRPEYLRETLDSWAHVRGIFDVEMTMFLEPSDRFNEMVRVTEESGLPIRLVVNGQREGVLVNPWKALDCAFIANDFVILAEEDVIVSSDILEYFEEQRIEYTWNDALGVCAYSGREVGDPSKVHLSLDFSVLLWGTWYHNWRNYIRDAWDKDYSTNNGMFGVEAGWDWELARLAKRLNKPFVHPEVSRSKHIGEFGGMHTTPETHRALRCPTFQLSRDPVDYSR